MTSRLTQCLAVFACFLMAGVAVCCTLTDEKEVVNMPAKEALEKLMQATGDVFLEKEKAFMGDKNDAIAVLSQKQGVSDADAFVAIYKRMLLNWMQGRSPNNDLVLKYLDGLPGRFLRTPLPSPSPQPAAAYISHHYQDSVVDLLAVRLLKQPEMEDWRVSATLIYFEEQKAVAITDLLLRFISQTEHAQRLEFALETLDAINDPRLDEKILNEKHRLHALGQDLPYALRSRISVD